MIALKINMVTVQGCYLPTLIVWCIKLKLKMFKDFRKDKKMFNFSNYSLKSKFYIDLNKLVVKKLKDETGAVAIEERIGLMPRSIHFWYMIVVRMKKSKGYK